MIKEGMSKIATEVYDILKELFPANPHRRVFLEHYILYKNTRLFFDFYVKEIGVFFECQGIQHKRFVKHFHSSIESFRAQKARDNLKIQYVEETNLYLVRIHDGEKITKELLLNKINIAYDSKYHFCD